MCDLDLSASTEIKKSINITELGQPNPASQLYPQKKPPFRGGF